MPQWTGENRAMGNFFPVPAGAISALGSNRRRHACLPCINAVKKGVELRTASFYLRQPLLDLVAKFHGWRHKNGLFGGIDEVLQ